MRKVFAVAILFACTSLVALAQNSGKDGPKDSSSSNSGASANAGVINNVNSGGGGFITALPGPTSSPGPIPGLVASVSGWHLYRPLSEIPTTRLRAVRKKYKPKESHSTFVGEEEQNDDSIHLVDWWPDPSGYPEDDVLGEVSVIGKQWEPVLGPALWALAVLKEKTHSGRCAVYYRDLGKGVTSAHNIGIGFAASGTSQAGTGFAGAGGIGFGKSGTEIVERPQIMAVCLNKAALEHQRAPRAEEPKPQPTDDLRAALEELRGAVKELANRPTPSAPAPAPVVVETSKPCATLLNTLRSDFKDGEFVIHFDLDRSTIRDADRPAIRKIAALVKEDKSCRVQPKGDTCTLGSPKHNANLGRDRGWALYSALIEAGGEEIRSQVLPPLSGTYDAPASGNYALSRNKKPTSEARPENRRARLLIDPVDSGK